MSQPASTIVVSNISQNPLSMGGPNEQTIASGDSATWTAAQMPSLCSDVNFRSCFLMGLLTVTVNGQGLPQSSAQVHTFLDNIANNIIVLT